MPYAARMPSNFDTKVTPNFTWNNKPSQQYAFPSNFKKDEILNSNNNYSSQTFANKNPQPKSHFVAITASPLPTLHTWMQKKHSIVDSPSNPQKQTLQEISNRTHWTDP